MRKKEKILEALLDQKLLPLFYHDDAATSIGILKALYQAGIKVVEYTNRGVYAFDNFKLLRKLVDKHLPGLYIGIGTIKNTKWAKKFIQAGADFIICPSINVEVAALVKREGLLWIPGCLTPTEIAMAENAGATLIKIFPANLLGPSYITGIREIFPDLKFMPTGGVETDEKNLTAWFHAGVVAVGMGSKLFTKKLVEENDFEGLRNDAARALAMIKKITSR